MAHGQRLIVLNTTGEDGYHPSQKKTFFNKEIVGNLFFNTDVIYFICNCLKFTIIHFLSYLKIMRVLFLV